jgi:hypothetical protein
VRAGLAQAGAAIAESDKAAVRKKRLMCFI